MNKIPDYLKPYAVAIAAVFIVPLVAISLATLWYHVLHFIGLTEDVSALLAGVAGIGLLVAGIFSVIDFIIRKTL